MKKLISSTLALTMLVTPLISSACFADETKEPTAQCIQKEIHSEPSSEPINGKKSKEILTGTIIGAVALIVTIVATLKQFEDKLPEPIKAKFPFLFTKKAQEAQENIENEQTPEFTKNSITIETAEESNTIKNEPTEAVVADPSVPKNQTVETIDSNISNNKTSDTEAVKTSIKQSLTKNSTTDDTNWLSSIKDTTVHVWGTTKGSLSNAWNTAKGSLSNARDTATNSLSNAWDTTKGSLSNACDTAKDLLSNARDTATNSLSNAWGTTKASFSALPTQTKYVIGCAALTPLFFLGGYKVRKAINNLWTKRKEAAAAVVAGTNAGTNAVADAAATVAVDAVADAAATVAVDAAANAVADAAATVAVDAAANAVADAAATVAVDAAATVVSRLTSPKGELLLAKMSDGSYSLFEQIINPGAMKQILSARNKDGLCKIIKSIASRATRSKINDLATIIFPKIVEGNFERSLNNLFPQK